MGPLSEAVLMWRADAPDAPTGVVRNTKTDGATIYGTAKSVSIKWTIPTKLNGIAGLVKDNANFGINNYKVFYGLKTTTATTAGSAFTKTTDATLTTKELLPVYTQDVTSFTRGTYFYAVKASTIAGDSLYSASSAGIISAMAPAAPSAVIAYPEYAQTADSLKI